MNSRLLFNASAIVEISTGLTFLAAPTLLIGLLLGQGVSPIGVAIARVLGIALMSVGIAGWESQSSDVRLPPRTGLCTYNVGVAALLTLLATTGGISGPLLWPVVGLHGLIGATMLWVMSAHARDDRNI